MAIINAVTGNENIDTGAAYFRLSYRLPGRDMLTNFRQRPLAGDPYTVRNTRTFEAFAGHRADIHGSWTETEYDTIHPGMLLHIEANKTDASGDMVSGRIYLKLDEEGPVTRVRMTLNCDQRAAISEAYIVGPFRELPFSEYLSHGINAGMMIGKYHPSAYERVFRVEEITPASVQAEAARPRVRTLSGAVVSAPRERRRRGIDLD